MAGLSYSLKAENCMAAIKSESVADFIPESPADLPRNAQVVPRAMNGSGD